MTSAEVKKLLSTFPRAPLCDYPTPLQALNNLAKHISYDGKLFLKRDDLNGLGPGGNKVRPLEFLLGDALAQGCDHIITSGPVVSNLCVITAAACSKLSLPCTLIYNADEEKHPSGNIQLTKILEAEQIYLGECDSEERGRAVEDKARALIQNGKRPYIIRNGATSATGALGYINLVLELFESHATHGIDDIFVCGGNGGLASGVIFGNILLGMPYNIHVITVEHKRDELEDIIDNLLLRLKVLCNLDNLPSSTYKVWGDFRGNGWGYDTQNSLLTAEKFARYEGIFLDRIYNAKTAWGALELLKTKMVISKSACIINSGGFSSIFN